MTLPFRGLVKAAALLRTLAVLAVVVSLILASSVAAFAQAGGTNGNVTGRVVDASGAGIANAKVTLASPSGSFPRTTASGGHFSFLGIPSDTYVLSIEAPGYQTQVQSGVTVTGGASVALEPYRLRKQLQTIGRTVARSAASAFQPNLTIPQYTVSGSVLEAAQGKLASANEAAVLLAVPGFQIDYLGNLVLQGSATDQIHYQFDGVDFTDPASNGSYNQAFFNGIASVQVVPGAGDPSQGNSGAGVVNLLVKRGTYPGTGLLDVEALSRPYDNQVNVQYGAATANGRFSDYASFFGTRFGYQYGAYGTPASNYAFGTTGSAGYANSFQSETDAVNNFVYRFGKDNSQSLQFLYLGHAETTRGNYGGLPLQWSDQEPDTLALESFYTGNTNCQAVGCPTLSTAQLQQLQTLEPGQISIFSQLPNIVDVGSATLLKFEYTNQINSSTFFNARVFHADSFVEGNPTGTLTGPGSAFPLSGQSTGGSRFGTTFALDKQLGEAQLFTVSGIYEFNRPNFGAIIPLLGLEELGGNAIDFLKPPNVNAPVSASNPCPVVGGCYLQQFFYTKGGTPPVPPVDLASQQVQQEYGLGLRDQIQVTTALKADLGVRFDSINNGFGKNLYQWDENVQPVPGAPTDFFINNWNFVETPHFTEPRFGLSYRIGPNDAISATYGRSINLNGAGEGVSPEQATAFQQFAGIPANPNFAATGLLTGLTTTANTCFPALPFPVGATANSQPSYKGTVAGPAPTLQLGKPCVDYAQMLYSAEDAYYPEVAAVQPATFDNLDLTYGHQFKDGSAIKLNPFFRQGYDIQAITSNLIFNPVTGVVQFGAFAAQSTGRSTTTGVGLEFTLPERPSGLTGFVSMTYINEFSNTPPAGDNPYGQDFEPVILPQSLAAGNLYRAGFISPFSIHIGPSFKTKWGLRINPVLNWDIGYPYNAGLLTPLGPGVAAAFGPPFVNVPNTNLTDQYGPGGAPQYVDPTNPGSILAPNIAATRGTPESASGGGKLSKGLFTGDLTVEYQKPHSRVTIGAQVLDIFNNDYFLRPTVNTAWYPVTTGVGSPLTGQNTIGASFPQFAPLVNAGAYPYSPYLVNPFTQYPLSGTTNLLVPTTFRVYLQYAL
jgi:hypothetical protein